MRSILIWLVLLVGLMNPIKAQNQCPVHELTSFNDVVSELLYIKDSSEFLRDQDLTLLQKTAAKAAVMHLYDLRPDNLGPILLSMAAQNYDPSIYFYRDQLDGAAKQENWGEFAFAFGVFADLGQDNDTAAIMASEVIASEQASGLARLWAGQYLVHIGDPDAAKASRALLDLHQSQQSPFWKAWSAYEVAKLAWQGKIADVSGIAGRAGDAEYARSLSQSMPTLPFDSTELEILDKWLYAGEQFRGMECHRFTHEIYRELADISHERYNFEDAYALYEASLQGVRNASPAERIKLYAPLIDLYNEDLEADTFGARTANDGRRTYELSARAKPLSDKDYVARITAAASDAFGAQPDDLDYPANEYRTDILNGIQESTEKFIRKGVRRLAGGEAWDAAFGEYSLDDFNTALETLRSFYAGQGLDPNLICAKSMADQLAIIQGTRGPINLQECSGDPEQLIFDEIDLLLTVGNDAVLAGEFDKADEAFRALQKLADEIENAYYRSAAVASLGRVEEARGDHRKALERYAQAFLIHPGDVIVWLSNLCGREDLNLCFEDWYDRLDAGNAEIIRP